MRLKLIIRDIITYNLKASLVILIRANINYILITVYVSHAYFYLIYIKSKMDNYDQLDGKSSTDPKDGDMRSKFDKPPTYNGPKLNRRQQMKEKEINEMSKLTVLQELK